MVYNEQGVFDTGDMVRQYAGLVHRIAYHLMARLPQSILVEDLIQSGMIGLIEAARNYNLDKGASFETYAGIRIRGAMLDEVRRGDWTPRSVYRNSKKISEAISLVEKVHGRSARDSEIAAYLNVPVDVYHQMLNDACSAKVFALDEGGFLDEFGTAPTGEALREPLEEVQEAHFKASLKMGIASLPERERLVLVLYYDEGLNLKEIGEVLGVSESRISQIHAQAMARLQSRMKDWKRL